ncbi:uncharacterized protein E0L32_001892 [Thyridium curvatum]|uniref:Urease accessory protein UreF n=1 Tax=Thyridium curvatum TaxID=1093900 RepID=A0A507AM67_9PEZI|nr:uncharacterized protein E0L32_001787 [Thyridium curvatum]XP_030990028.1 uncharacterized protein E0L32_001892 [Thyridium curvatum]TPX08212.1 hypothetical protein E0L32_001787 [Thyridium curvatum]TPX08317.1 hypothetical protein E0L32_001892 [Thyridium curvatum]
MDCEGESQSDSQIEAHINDLKEQLAKAEAQLTQARSRASTVPVGKSQPVIKHAPIRVPQYLTDSQRPGPAHISPGNHFLLLLSDSALPLGSFAFSSGLESYLAHTTPRAAQGSSSPSSFTASFLPLSVASYASTTLPFVLAAHRQPSRLPALDDALDAAIVCTVGRRASTAQGRALLSIWERSLGPHAAAAAASSSVLRDFAALLRGPPGGTTTADVDDDDLPPPVSAHLPPLFGVVAGLLGLELYQTAYVFLLSHVKALVSAAVRAGILGPYQAQKILASGQVQDLVATSVQREWGTEIEEAGQSVPVMDLWVGRHEMLYSRIFNS